MNNYLFDSNCFLDASLRYYQNDYFSDFWEWIRYLLENNVIKTTKKVKQELIKKGDFVSKFIKGVPHKYFIDDKKYLQSYIEIINKANSLDFTSNAIAKFADENHADAWLIAIALKDDYTIVSNEKIPDNRERKNIKIPRICNELNIKCINIFDFIKEQRIHFCIKDFPKDRLF